jgi:hypothetical protein
LLLEAGCTLQTALLFKHEVMGDKRRSRGRWTGWRWGRQRDRLRKTDAAKKRCRTSEPLAVSAHRLCMGGEPKMHFADATVYMGGGGREG